MGRGKPVHRLNSERGLWSTDLNSKPGIRRWFLRLSIGYLIVVALGCIWLRVDSDVRALTALFLYGPRWVCALPLAFSIPLAILSGSWWCRGIVVATALGIAGPLMGGAFSPENQLDTPPAYARFRVVSWNAGGTTSMEAFRKFQNEFRPDVVLIQESPITLSAADFPTGWKLTEGVSGLRVASLYPSRLEESLGLDSLPIPGGASRFTLDTPEGVLTVHNIHLPTIRPGIETAVGSKLANLSDLRKVLPLQALASKTIRQWIGDPMGMSMIGGDFNMPVESQVYRREWSNMPNAFSEAGNGWGGTKVTSWHRVRIDHILYGPRLHCRHCVVGPNLGSDHLPVVADLTLEDGS